MKPVIFLLYLFLVSFSASSLAQSCGSDAECDTDEICNDEGQCVDDGRDWKALKSENLRLKALLDNVISPEHPAAEPVDIPLTDDVIDGSKSANKSMKSKTICGLLEYIRFDGYYQVYKAIAGGRITVNFSQGGRITSRMTTWVVKGQIYRYQANNVNVGFTCH